MVYKRTSVGCHRCRQRHVKCDLARPACQRCISIDLECPGYRDHGGFVFCNQQSKRSRKKSSMASGKRSDSSAIAVVVKDDPATTSVTFFFNSFLGITRDPATSRGHFTDLMKFYSEGSPSSPIVLAAKYMAAQSMAHATRSHVSARLSLDQLHMDAVRSLRAAISNENQDTLQSIVLAVLCLDFADQISYRSSRRQSIRNPAHVNGALALIQRWRNNHDDQAKDMLAAATMSSYVQLAIDEQDNARDLTISKLPVISRCSSVGVKPAVELDEMVADVLRISQWCKTVDLSTRSELLHVLGIVEQRSSQWRQCVLGSRSAIFGAKEESIISLDAAYMCSQWCCLRLMLLKLRLVLGACDSDSMIGTIYETADDTMRLLNGSSTRLLETASKVGDPDCVLANWFLERTISWVLWILDDFMRDAELNVDHASAEFVRGLQRTIDTTYTLS